MIAGLVWTVLRQYRVQILVTAILLIALILAVSIESLTVAALTTELHNATCPPARCNDITEQLDRRFLGLDQLLPYIGLLPVAVGAFWGAPLVGREYESGTVKFAWTQSVTRRAWILARMSVLGILIALGGAVLGIAMDHWLSLYIGIDLHWAILAESGFIQLRGVAPVAWWLFGFTLGCAGGALFRRTIPAIAVTTIVVVAALIARNLLVASMTVGQPSTAAQFLPIEATALLAASALLTVATCRSVEHARA